MGISFTDLAYLKPEDVRKDRLVYRRKKTGQELNIKLQQHTLQILRSYGTNECGYLLPILPKDIVEGSKEAKKVISQWIKTTNKYLSKLTTLCDIDAEVNYLCYPSLMGNNCETIRI